MKITVLDGHCLNPGDLSWDALGALGELKIFPRTAPDRVLENAAGAAALLTNKALLPASVIDQLPDLRYIGVLATGYNVVDVEAAKRRGIVVCNVPTYGTASVSQFVFALLLELCHHVTWHSDSVREGGWSRNKDWSYTLAPQMELAGKTMGIVGFGRIGRQTARIAEAFDMRVVSCDVNQGSLEQVLREADVVSLHAPLTAENREMINARSLALMKPTAYLINTSRGPLINERDLADALKAGAIAGAALDVLTVEPPVERNPLFSARNCIVTPHMAWSTREARGRLMQTAVENVAAFVNGRPQNVII